MARLSTTCCLQASMPVARTSGARRPRSAMTVRFGWRFDPDCNSLVGLGEASPEASVKYGSHSLQCFVARDGLHSPAPHLIETSPGHIDPGYTYRLRLIVRQALDQDVSKSSPRLRGQTHCLSG